MLTRPQRVGRDGVRIIRLQSRGTPMMQTFLRDDIVHAIRGYDFCLECSIANSYACQDFSYEDNQVFGEKLVGIFFACRECAGLIDLNAWNDLTEHVFDTFLFRNEVCRLDALQVRVRIAEVHQMFREHRICEHNEYLA